MYKGGKRFGPYYFKSVRNKDGSVSSIYLGKKNPEGNSLKFLGMIFLIIFLVSLFGYFSYTALVVSDVVDSNSEISSEEVLQEESPVKEDPVVEVEPIEPEEEVDEPEVNNSEEVNNTEIDEPVINLSEPEEINDTEINETIPYFNISEENLSEINISEEINNTEINETIYDLNLSNITELNLTELNLTEINISLNLTNESLNVTESNVSMNISEISYNIIINQPVKFEKTIELDEEVSRLEVSLPENATNVSVYKITDEIVDEKPYKIFEEPIVQEDSGNLITGGVIFEIDKISFDVINFFRNLFRFTGLVSFEETATKFDNGSLIVEGPVKDLKVEYYMPGPRAEEIQVSDWQKQIILSNPLNYSKILVYTNITNTKGGINVVDSLNNKIKYNSIDSNNDSYYDYIEWISDAQNETFNVSIVILNFQSFPVVGRDWFVYFNTTGQADLKVTPINGTSWSFDGHDGDLGFLNFSCGESVLESYYENGSYVVPNYNCNQTGSESSHVITSGGHYLEFDFGGQKAYARNTAVCGATINGRENLTGDLLNCAGSGLIIGTNATEPWITVDCNGFTIDGVRAASSNGITFSGRSNFTLKNCVIKDFVEGVYGSSATRSVNISVTNNTIYNITNRFFYLATTSLPSSTNISIANNTMYNNSGAAQTGIYLDGRLENITIFDNSIIAISSVIYLTNTIYARYINISGNKITNMSLATAAGIQFAGGYVNSSIIENNYIESGIRTTSTYGIRFNGAGIRDNVVNNNTLYNITHYAVYLVNDQNNTFFRNNISNSTTKHMIYISNSSNLTLDSNNLSFTQPNGNGTGFDAIRIYGLGYTNGSYPNLWRINGTNNINITNNRIWNISGYGISIGQWQTIGGTGISIENNTIYNTNFTGIALHGCNDTRIINNTLYSTSINDTSHGSQIYLYPGIGSGTAVKQSMGHTGQNFVIENNTIMGTFPQAAGVYINTMSNSLVKGNNIFNNTRGNTVSNSTNITFYNNNFTNEGISTVYYANLAVATNTTFCTFESNNIVQSNWTAIRIYGGSNNNIFLNNWLNNNGGKSNHGVYVGESTRADNCTFINNTINGSAASGIYISYAYNTVLINNTIINNGLFTSSNDVYTGANSVGNETLLLNNTFVNASTNHVIYSNWFLGIHVNTSDTADYANANVSFFNVSGTLNFSELTGANGWTSIRNLTEMKNISTGVAIINTNFTFNITTNNISYSNYTMQQLNLTRSTFLYITLLAAPTSPNIPTVSLISLDGTNSTTSGLNCTATISDNNLDKMNVTVNWTKNNVQVFSLDYTNGTASHQSGYLFSSILGAGNLTIGDVWNCSIKLYDGAFYSGWGNSSNLNVRDAFKPSIYFVDPTPINGIRTSNNVTVNVTVIDNTNTSAFIDWNRSLVGYWSMDSYNNTAVGDNSSWKNHASYAGSLTSSGITTGKYGNSIQFDGITNYLNVGTGIMPDSSYHTITAWIKINTAGVPGSDHYGILVGSDVDSPYSGLALYINKSDGEIGTYSGGWIYSSTNKVTDDVWTFVAIRGYKHASNGYIDISKNAGAWERIFSGDTTKLAVDSDNQFNIGRWAGNNYFTYGSIDEVKLYNRVLSQGELQSEYNNSVYPLQNYFDNLVRGGLYNYTAYAIDSYGNLNTTESRNLTVNQVPYPTSFNLTPVSPDTAENLDCNFTFVDGDDLSSLVNVSWYNTSVKYSEQVYNVSNNTMFNVTLQASLTAMDEVWNCSILPYDNIDYGTINFSNSVNITGNNAPSMNYVNITPSSLNTTVNLMGYCNASDIDNNNLSYYYNWYLNGVLNTSGRTSIYS
nr:hypothetical protein [Nanoarchaeum sp.]